VTLTLKALFQSSYAKFFVFKGGTSLSKGWKLISRFSEDIDIALDPEAFGMQYLENPSNKYVDKLRRNGCVFTSTLLKDELAKQLISLDVPEGAVSIEAKPVQ
jgi:predicted nucleotidyltransferase component of viral defense system